MNIEQIAKSVPEWQHYKGQDRYLDQLLLAIEAGFAVDAMQLFYLMDKVDQKLEEQQQREAEIQ